MLITQLVREELCEPTQHSSRVLRLLQELERLVTDVPCERPRDPRLVRALDAMRARPGEAWTVERLAKHSGMSRAAFARHFLTSFGVTPLRHLQATRMSEARALLVSSDAALAEIAAAVGYRSEFAFSRAFKRYHGEPPGEFRRNNTRHAFVPSAVFTAPRMAA